MAGLCCTRPANCQLNDHPQACVATPCSVVQCMMLLQLLQCGLHMQQRFDPTLRCSEICTSCLITASQHPHPPCVVYNVVYSCVWLLQVERVVPFSSDCTLRTMRLSNISSALPRGGDHVLNHYHFHAWPDHGTPDNSAGLRAVCRSLSTARDSGKPVVVHCSAGGSNDVPQLGH